MNVHTIAGGGGLNLHVREWGNPAGLTILLVHGWSQSHLCWQRQLESTLAEDFRLVALDNRGHGMSDSPAAGEYILDDCKTAESSWYVNIGHAPFLEDAGRFNDELADFTRRCRA